MDSYDLARIYSYFFLAIIIPVSVVLAFAVKKPKPKKFFTVFSVVLVLFVYLYTFAGAKMLAFVSMPESAVSEIWEKAETLDLNYGTAKVYGDDYYFDVEIHKDSSDNIIAFIKERMGGFLSYERKRGDLTCVVSAMDGGRDYGYPHYGTPASFETGKILITDNVSTYIVIEYCARDLYVPEFVGFLFPPSLIVRHIIHLDDVAEFEIESEVDLRQDGG